MDVSGNKTVFKVNMPDFDKEYDEKYLLLEIISNSNNKRTWLVLSGRRRYHSGILSDFQQERSLRQRNEEIVVHGGGILKISNGEAKTFGSSGGFGMVPAEKLEIVKKCLNTRKDFKTKQVEATNYIRD